VLLRRFLPLTAIHVVGDGYITLLLFIFCVEPFGRKVLACRPQMAVLTTKRLIMVPRLSLNFKAFSFTEPRYGVSKEKLGRTEYSSV
jgi:hypothetical protein